MATLPKYPHDSLPTILAKRHEDVMLQAAVIAAAAAKKQADEQLAALQSNKK